MTNKTPATAQKIKTFFEQLQKENRLDDYENFHYLDFDNFLDYEQIAEDLNNGDDIDFETITELYQESDSEQIEFIYYFDAINYLKENDQSLSESLEIANEYGFTCDNLNSCVLASLLATQEVRSTFYTLNDEINEFFEQFNN